jgi:hypothetical protein
VSSLSDAKRNLRERSEHHLRLAVLRELGRDEPSTVEPYRSEGGAFWRLLFVPVYRRLPWRVKERAMGALGMTAKGWQAPARRPGEPWRPPAGPPPPAGSAGPAEPPPEA